MHPQDRIKIFIIEDNMLFAHLLEKELAKILENENHTIHVFENGELCEQFLHIKPDLVLVDFHLNSQNASAMNGLGVINMMRSHNQDTDFIMITNNQHSELFFKVKEIGAYDYLIKNSNIAYQLDLTMQKWIKLIKHKKQIA